jgi:hypothetical protein
MGCHFEAGMVLRDFALVGIQESDPIHSYGTRSTARLGRSSIFTGSHSKEEPSNCEVGRDSCGCVVHCWEAETC